MAARKIKTKKLSDIKSLTTTDLNKLTRSELASYVRDAADIANKRLKRMEGTSAGEFSPAYQSWKRAGSRRFSAGRKNLNELRSEFRRAVRFLELKTSTTRNTNQMRRRVIELTGLEGLSLENEKKLWELYRQYNAYARYYGIEFDSESEIKAVADIFKQMKNWSKGDIDKLIAERYDKMNVGSQTMYVDKLTGDTMTRDEAFTQTRFNLIMERAERLTYKDPSMEDLNKFFGSQATFGGNEDGDEYLWF